MSTIAIITKEDVLKHWQGHRSLTRRTIEKFPEKELFDFSIGGMRTFAVLIKELLTVGLPSLESIVNGDEKTLDHDVELNSKEELLNAWDDQTEKINTLFNQIEEERFKQHFVLFGQYEGIIVNHILYFIDNEIHHRAQGFVYLRQLGIEPPYFWER